MNVSEMPVEELLPKMRALLVGKSIEIAHSYSAIGNLHGVCQDVKYQDDMAVYRVCLAKGNGFWFHPLSLNDSEVHGDLPARAGGKITFRLASN